MRRLGRESEQLRDDFTGHEYIRVQPVGAEPAEHYTIEYWVRGVTIAPGSTQPEYADYHRVGVTLPNDYPRVKPLFVTQTPVFHPNFGSRLGDEICIADYWAPSQTLSDIVIKVGEMLQYRDYNLKSPLNAQAARWADENSNRFPVGDKAVTRVGYTGPDARADTTIELSPDAAPADGEPSTPEADNKGDNNVR